MKSLKKSIREMISDEEFQLIDWCEDGSKALVWSHLTADEVKQTPHVSYHNGYYPSRPSRALARSAFLKGGKMPPGFYILTDEVREEVSSLMEMGLSMSQSVQKVLFGDVLNG